MTKARWVPFFVFVFVTLLFFRGLFLDPRHLPSVKIGHPMPNFILQSLTNVPFSTRTIKGPSLLNVWASWCDACASEQAYLMRLAHQGVRIYGLNYEDDLSAAKAWLKTKGNPYVSIGHDVEGQVAIDFGVYGAPETFLIDKKRVIRYRHVGPLTQQVWKRELLPRLQALEEGS